MNKWVQLYEISKYEGKLIVKLKVIEFKKDFF